MCNPIVCVFFVEMGWKRPLNTSYWTAPLPKDARIKLVLFGYRMIVFTEELSVLNIGLANLYLWRYFCWLHGKFGKSAIDLFLMVHSPASGDGYRISKKKLPCNPFELKNLIECPS